MAFLLNKMCLRQPITQIILDSNTSPEVTSVSMVEVSLSGFTVPGSPDSFVWSECRWLDQVKQKASTRVITRTIADCTQPGPSSALIKSEITTTVHDRYNVDRPMKLGTMLDDFFLRIFAGKKGAERVRLRRHAEVRTSQ